MDKAKHGVRLLKNLMYSYEYYRKDDEARLSISDDGETVEDISQVALAQRLMVEKCKELQPVFKKGNVRLEIEIVAFAAWIHPAVSTHRR